MIYGVARKGSRPGKPALWCDGQEEKKMRDLGRGRHVLLDTKIDELLLQSLNAHVCKI
jgi:hypothetical protein